MTTQDHITEIRAALASQELTLADGWYSVEDGLLPAEDMRLIAACSPDAMHAILDELAARERRAEDALAERNRLDVELSTAQIQLSDMTAERDKLAQERRSQHDADSRELRQLCADRDAARQERDNLIDAMREEIDENLRLRELGGAGRDEGITAMTERVISERDKLAAELEQERARCAAICRDEADRCEREAQRIGRDEPEDFSIGGAA